MFKQFHFLSFFLVFLFLEGCQTSAWLNGGIQPGYEAVNPAAIIAVPIFIMPDPSSEFSKLDPSLIITEKLIPALESKIIGSFENQPNINGYPFQVVKKAIGFGEKKNQILSKTQSPSHEDEFEKKEDSNKEKIVHQKAQPLIWDKLDTTMKDVASRFSSRDVKTRLLITSNCLARKNFIEFYSYCLASEKNWLSGLNALSARVLNADSALITVITDLQNTVVDKKYEITGGLAILLVDTNNGKLIWGNYVKETLVNPEDMKYFPSWSEFLNKVFVSEFWNGFPGRIGKNQLKVSDDL